MANHDSIHCPSCRHATHITIVVRANDNKNGYIWEIAECNSCDQRFLVQRDGSGVIHKMYPDQLARPVNQEIPAAIRKDIEEALTCLASGAYRAAAAMARRAMQSVCLDKDAPRKKKITTKDGKQKTVKVDLIEQIDWLEDQRIITPDLRDWAHEVRSVGNKGVHPADAEDTESVSKDDADEVIQLVEAFCSSIYVTTSLFKKRQAANSESKTAA
jgi:hypothetical protein